VFLPYPDETVLKLSELFEKPLDLGVSEKQIPLLELEVKVININEGRNEEMVSRCKDLAEYSSFIARVRTFMEEGDNLEEALRKAVKYCRKHGMLKQFLDIHGSEVLNMLLTEWNLEDAKKVWYEDGLEDGREEGREEKELEIARNALAEGSTPEFVQKITGLDIEIIRKLKEA